MSFTTQLLKGCVMLDIVNVVNRYLVPKNPTFKQMCNLGIVEHLLDYCQNNIPDWNDGLYDACRGGQLEIVNLMIKKGANDWNLGLEYACEGGHFAYDNAHSTRFAYDNAHSTRFAYDNARSTRFAYDNARSTRLEIVNLMIEKGADDLDSGLSSACGSGNLEIVNLMIEKGANDWYNGLSNACYYGHLEIINLLIEKGANDWNEGLSNACEGGNFASDNPFCAKGTKRALLEANARSTHLEIVKLMIEKGATQCNSCSNHEF
jgi:ankyrin repeat protein